VTRNVAGVRHQLEGGGEPFDEQLGYRQLDPAAKPWTFRQDFANLGQQPGTRHYLEGIACLPSVDDTA